MDGVTASREIRKFSQIPIIAITAGALKEEQDRCLAAGMNAFLTKPVLAAELQDTLSQILEQVLQPVEVKHAPSAKQAERFNKEVLLSNISGDTENTEQPAGYRAEDIPSETKRFKTSHRAER
jgi:DNA-binding response OmpR family regulator